MIHRSTALRLAAQHCPRALDFYEEHAPYNREIFAAGTAAHCVVEDAGKAAQAKGDYLTSEEVEAVARATCEGLITNGRDFYGHREAPLNSTAVWNGRDLALAFIRDVPPPYDGQYEVDLAVTKDWLPCPYGPEAFLAARLDFTATRVPGLLDFDDEEEAGGPVRLVRDYKSAWSADDGELRTIQRKIQAVLDWIHNGAGHEALELQVVNLRTRKTHSLTVYPNTPEGSAVMARWKADILSEIKARDVQRGADGRRPATPGAVCFGCPYLGRCEDAAAWVEAVEPGLLAPEDMAASYAAASAFAEHLEPYLRNATKEAPIEVPGGVVGILPQEQSELSAEAPQRLADLWIRRTHPESAEAANAALPGLLTALKLGRAQAVSLLTHMFKGSAEERAAREKHLGSMSQKKVTRKFGVHRGKGKE